MFKSILVALAFVASADTFDTFESPSLPIDLGLKNFTAITQIGDGMTTGSWFVKFYAPWCGHCKRLAPIWEEVTPALKAQGVLTASVNCPAERKLCHRFSIQGYPTVLFFKDNKMYKFKGSRTKEALERFATTGYEKATAYRIPKPPTLTRRFLNAINELLH